MAVGVTHPTNLKKREDVEPSKLIWALLGAVVLVCVLCLLVIRSFSNSYMIDFKTNNLGVAVVGLLVIIKFANWLGGFKHIFSEWYYRNFVGIDLVMWIPNPKEKPSEYSAELRSRKMRETRAVKNSWVIYLPMGGWYSKPVLCNPINTLVHPYLNDLRIKSFRNGHSLIATDVCSVTVTDDRGSRLVLHPFILLGLLEEVWPRPLNGNFPSERSLVDLLRAAALKAKSGSSVRASQELGKTLAFIDKTTRLKDSVEGKKLRDHLVAVVARLSEEPRISETGI